MKILVVTASKHNATNEVGDAIVDTLRQEGHEATRVSTADVSDFDGYDAVVLGSAVYMTQWMETMRNLVSHHGPKLRSMPVFAFSVGLSGVPVDVKVPERAAVVVEGLDPMLYTVFKGRLNPELLGLRERSIVRMGTAPEGDFRDWDAIADYAKEVSRQLNEHLGAASGA